MLHIGAGHSNNCQIILKLFGCDKFCNNLQHKKLSSKFGGITYVTNRGKPRVMLQIGAGHSNNCQVKLKLFGYDKF